MTEFPVRQKSAQGQPKPETTIERRCKACGASFAGLAPCKTGERGLWRDWRWYCSVECDPTPSRASRLAAGRKTPWPRQAHGRLGARRITATTWARGSAAVGGWSASCGSTRTASAAVGGRRVVT